MNQSQKNLILKYKDPKQKHRAREKGQANTCTRSRSFCFIYQNDKTKRKGGENKPMQAQNGAKRANIQNTHEKPRKTQIISPQGQQRGKE